MILLEEKGKNKLFFCLILLFCTCQLSCIMLESYACRPEQIDLTHQGQFLMPHSQIQMNFSLEMGVAEWLTPQTPDLDIQRSSLARRVVSLDKELYSTLSLLTHVYKGVPATYYWGVTLQWTSIPSRGE